MFILSLFWRAGIAGERGAMAVRIKRGLLLLWRSDGFVLWFSFLRQSTGICVFINANRNSDVMSTLVF